MTESAINHALHIEQSCAMVASAFSEGRREGVRLISGEHRSFGLGPNRLRVHIPFPLLAADWTLRTLTCGVALQCSPSKDRIAQLPLHALTPRELRALSIVEGGVALGWVISRWPGLTTELTRLLPDLERLDGELDGPSMLYRACELAQSRAEIMLYPLLGRLPMNSSGQDGLLASLRKLYGRMPWSSKKRFSKGRFTIPVGGDGGVQNPNLPPPSRPEEEDVPIRADQRAGIPYPEWNIWTQRFLPHHVAVLERKHPPSPQQSAQASTNLRRWFEAHTHRSMKNRLEDGSDLDVDRYINHYVDVLSGTASDARVFRDLLPAARDVTTALLLDGSSSLGIHQGRVFQLELACADALSQAMALARERHGLFVFSGNTRHRVDVVCLKDFTDRRTVIPGNLGLSVGGYTRLGAPLRHLTSRLLEQPSERRLLIVIGDGLMSDEGYEGHYAWADVAHAVEEAEDAGVFLYYIGVGPARVDPLPDVFGAQRSTRIRRIEELPRVLAHVHQQLVAA
ncbi:MAG: VWA domain-containing protein [Gammaproteobacteria bacterium]|nr:VWA domain-containing protein [Gammaproteobacteria bacterium]